MILQQHTRQWYDLLTILLTRWHGKVLKLCLLVDFLLKLLARISLVLSLEEEDHSQLQGDTTVRIAQTLLLVEGKCRTHFTFQTLMMTFANCKAWVQTMSKSTSDDSQVFSD